MVAEECRGAYTYTGVRAADGGAMRAAARMQENCEGAGGALVPHAQEAITDARIPVRSAAGERGTAGGRDTAPEALACTV